MEVNGLMRRHKEITAEEASTLGQHVTILSCEKDARGMFVYKYMEVVGNVEHVKQYSADAVVYNLMAMQENDKTKKEIAALLFSALAEYNAIRDRYVSLVDLVVKHTEYSASMKLYMMKLSIIKDVENPLDDSMKRALAEYLVALCNKTM